MKPILIVDDEKAIVDLIKLALTHAGYACQCAYDGNTAADMIEQTEYDLILLDIMLPEIDGYDLMEYIAPTGTPVIFITAKASVKDRVKGLSMGADDYIVKPFAPSELVARVQSLLRRCNRSNSMLTAFHIAIDPISHTVLKSGVVAELTPMEFALLTVLLQNRGIALYRDVLYRRVWGDSEQACDTRTLDIHISRLRKKLGLDTQIKTISKIGYMLENDK